MPTLIPPRVLIVATSLSPNSRSSILAERARTTLGQNHPDVVVDLIDLRTIGPIPMAGTPEAYQPHPALDALRRAVESATHVIFAVPIYNFSGSAAAKNVIELMSERELGGKTVGFLCSAGGAKAYMSVLHLANALMLDFRCWIVPRFVYATGSDFADGAVQTPEIIERIEQMVGDMLRHGPVAAE